MSNRIKYCGGLLIGGTSLVLFITTAEASRLASAFADANYWYVIPAILLYQLSTLFRAFRWRLIMKHLETVDALQLYPVIVVGYMANNLLPLRLGELVRSHYLGDRTSISKISALATILVERLADAVTLIAFIAVVWIAIPFFMPHYDFYSYTKTFWLIPIVGVSSIFLIMFGGLVLLAYRPSKATSIIVSMVSPLPELIKRVVEPITRLFITGLTSLRKPKRMSEIFLLSIPVWLLESALFFVLGYSFDLHDSYSSQFEMAAVMILVTSIANVGSSLPAAPGGIGLFELIARETMMIMPFATIDRTVATAYVAVVHSVLLLPMIALGWIFLITQNLSLRTLSRFEDVSHIDSGSDLVDHK